MIFPGFAHSTFYVCRYFTLYAEGRSNVGKYFLSRDINSYKWNGNVSCSTDPAHYSLQSTLSVYSYMLQLHPLREGYSQQFC